MATTQEVQALLRAAVSQGMSLEWIEESEVSDYAEKGMRAKVLSF